MQPFPNNFLIVSVFLVSFRLRTRHRLGACQSPRNKQPDVWCLCIGRNRNGLLELSVTLSWRVVGNLHLPGLSRKDLLLHEFCLHTLASGSEMVHDQWCISNVRKAKEIRSGARKPVDRPKPMAGLVKLDLRRFLGEKTYCRNNGQKKWYDETSHKQIFVLPYWTRAMPSMASVL